MKERPIVMTAESVRGILAGRKTQTRRVIKPQPTTWGTVKRQPFTRDEQPGIWSPLSDNSENVKCPYGVPGDRLWVRERFQRCGCDGCQAVWPKRGPHGISGYYATYPGPNGAFFRSMIFMPRWASRITLEITEVRVQRVKDISKEDALEEGCGFDFNDEQGPQIPRINFSVIWDDINKKRGSGWDSNPWVWALTFKRVEA
jgi:hypothetical protein